MLQSVNFEWAMLPIPTILDQLFEIDENSLIGGRILFESVELQADDGQILRIHEVELIVDRNYGVYELKLIKMIVVNKIDKKWFKITMHLHSSKKFIECLKFSQMKIQVYYGDANNFNYIILM